MITLIENDATAGALTVARMCRLYNIGRTYLYEQLKAGRLVAHKAGAKTLIQRSEAERWFSSLPQMGARK